MDDATRARSLGWQRGTRGDERREQHSARALLRELCVLAWRPDYLRLGEDLAAARLPTLFVFEGGYAVPEVGVNVANALEGLQQRA
jgi:hypothetical protein